MEGVADFIVDFLQLNEGIQFSTLLICFFIYIGLLWVAISIWVYTDAKKRFDNEITAILFGVLVFILNIPIFIFYLAIRPDIKFEDFDDWEAGGVNVPIVNFMGKEGIEMSLELRINPKRLRETDKTPDMNVEIGWDNQDEKFRLIDKDKLIEDILEKDSLENFSERQSTSSIDKTNQFKVKIVNYFDKVAGQARKKVEEVRSKIKQNESTNKEIVDYSNKLNDAQFVENKKKKKKKKKR